MLKFNKHFTLVVKPQTMSAGEVRTKALHALFVIGPSCRDRAVDVVQTYSPHFCILLLMSDLQYN